MAETEWGFDASGDAIGGFGWASSLVSRGIIWLYDLSLPIVFGSAHTHIRDGGPISILVRQASMKWTFTSQLGSTTHDEPSANLAAPS